MSTTVSTEFVDALRDASVFAPELPEQEARNVFELVRSYEQELILPKGTSPRELTQADYALGSATEADELNVLNESLTGVLLSADHATDPMRKGILQGADHGTGGLVGYLAVERQLTGLIPIGRQTGNAAVTPDHPIKLKMDELLPYRAGFLSVHGMISGKLESLSDKTEIHGLIGLGHTPNDASRAVAEKLTERAKDFGLRVKISNDFNYQIHDPTTNGLKYDPETNEPKQGQLAALGAGTTTNRANMILQENGLVLPAFQIEMTRLLRLIPSDFESGWHGDQKAREMGVYLGYMLVNEAINVLNEYN